MASNLFLFVFICFVIVFLSHAICSPQILYVCQYDWYCTMTLPITRTAKPSDLMQARYHCNLIHNVSANLFLKPNELSVARFMILHQLWMCPSSSNCWSCQDGIFGKRIKHILRIRLDADLYYEEDNRVVCIEPFSTLQWARTYCVETCSLSFITAWDVIVSGFNYETCYHNHARRRGTTKIKPKPIFKKSERCNSVITDE